MWQEALHTFICISLISYRGLQYLPFIYVHSDSFWFLVFSLNCLFASCAGDWGIYFSSPNVAKLYIVSSSRTLTSSSLFDISSHGISLTGDQGMFPFVFSYHPKFHHWSLMWRTNCLLSTLSYKYPLLGKSIQRESNFKCCFSSHQSSSVLFSILE